MNILLFISISGGDFTNFIKLFLSVLLVMSDCNIYME